MIDCGYRKKVISSHDQTTCRVSAPGDWSASMTTWLLGSMFMKPGRCILLFWRSISTGSSPTVPVILKPIRLLDRLDQIRTTHGLSMNEAVNLTLATTLEAKGSTNDRNNPKD